MENQNLKQLYYINTDLILFSNNRLNQMTLRKMTFGFEQLDFRVVPVYKTDRGFLLTDGNHYVTAAKLNGVTHVPAVLLTKEEFDYVKFSKRQIDIKVADIHHARVINNL